MLSVGNEGRCPCSRKRRSCIPFSHCVLPVYTHVLATGLRSSAARWRCCCHCGIGIGPEHEHGCTEEDAMAGETILVVDNDHSLLRLMDIRLEAAGYQALLASSGEEALIRSRESVCDLAIV